MDLKHMEDQELLQQTKIKALAERKLTLEIIEHLEEIESRKLYARRGFSSLFLYCTKELGYSESEAYRRISAMRLVRQIPEVTEKIQSGSLTLTNVVQAATFFKAEEKQKREVTLENKRDILSSLENKSSREAEKQLRKQAPLPLPAQEKTRALTDEHVEVKIVLDKSLQAKLDELKSLLSHKNPNMSHAELISDLADIALKELKPKDPSSLRRTSSSALKVRSGSPSDKPFKNSRYIPKATKSFVWKRDQGKCSYADPLTKRKCESRHFLQYDHIHPFALGGTSEVKNIRLLCATHNQLRTLESS
jgi:hypothetical protein